VPVFSEELHEGRDTTGDDQHLREEDRMNHARGARCNYQCGDSEGKISYGDDRSEVLESTIPPRRRDERPFRAGGPSGGLPWCALNPAGSPICPAGGFTQHPGILFHTQRACCASTGVMSF
jgi:hypothetical protein